MHLVSFSLVAFVAFVDLLTFRRRHIDSKSNRLLGRKFYCGFRRGKIQRILTARFKAPQSASFCLGGINVRRRHLKRFWGKREGFFGGSGFRAETGKSSRHEKESIFRIFNKSNKSKAEIKRAQSLTRLGFAEQKQSRRSQQSQQMQQLFLREERVHLYILQLNKCNY